MIFTTPVLEGVLLQRYKRFLADVVVSEAALDCAAQAAGFLPERLSEIKKHRSEFGRASAGEVVVLAHVPNSGSMLGVKAPGSVCRVSLAANLERKILFTLEMVQVPQTRPRAATVVEAEGPQGNGGGTWVGINTSLPNKLVREVFEAGLIPDWKTFDKFTPEVKISAKSRIDVVLEKASGEKCFIEIKNVSMARPPLAVFPDAVTERGQKHLQELMELVRQGNRAEIVFVVQRNDCDDFATADDIDPTYGRLFLEALKAGVRVRVLRFSPEASGVRFDQELKQPKA